MATSIMLQLLWKCSVTIVDLKEYLYCSQCGTKLGIAVPSFRLLLSSENVTEREAIEAYFNSGFSYNAILCFLEKYHDVSMSLSTLKRRLSQYNLKRNKTDVDLTDVERQNKLDGLLSFKQSGFTLFIFPKISSHRQLLTFSLILHPRTVWQLQFL